ncbi:2307_t:CDS:10, partial [Scutellospora calospora]
MAETTDTSSILTLENYEGFRTNAYITLEAYAKKQKSTLPPGEVAFRRTVDPASALALEKISTRIKNKLNRLLVNADIPGSEMIGRVNDVKDFDIWFKDLVTLNDSLIDGVNASLDELTGRNQKFASFTADASTSMVAQVRAKSGDFNIVYSRNITRPQAKFKDKVDNSGVPFVPKLPNKPNATVPLKLDGIEEGSSYPHPYLYEITHLTYPSFIFEEKEPILYQHLETTPLTWVDTLEGLTAMCQKLDTSQEIAVDLEHHDYRSYQGFTCLIQISTRFEDFIVDALELRHHLHMLNNSFTNPNILKNSVTTTYNLLKVTLDRSAEISLKCYETYRYDHSGDGPNGYQKLLAKWSLPLNRQQVLAVFKVLHAWRDSKAREEDESIAYMPEDSKDITAFCRNIVPPLVRENTLELVNLITEAKNSVLNSTSIFDSKPMEIDHEIKTVTSNIIPITNSKNVRWVLDTSLPKYNADNYKEKKSVLFGDLFIEKVSEILSNLTFAPPILPKSILYGVNKINSQSEPKNEPPQLFILPAEHIFVPPEAR